MARPPDPSLTLLTSTISASPSSQSDQVQSHGPCPLSLTPRLNPGPHAWLPRACFIAEPHPSLFRLLSCRAALSLTLKPSPFLFPFVSHQWKCQCQSAVWSPDLVHTTVRGWFTESPFTYRTTAWNKEAFGGILSAPDTDSSSSSWLSSRNPWVASFLLPLTAGGNSLVVPPHSLHTPDPHRRSSLVRSGCQVCMEEAEFTRRALGACKTLTRDQHERGAPSSLWRCYSSWIKPLEAYSHRSKVRVEKSLLGTLNSYTSQGLVRGGEHLL